MPDLRVWGYGIRSMPTTLTHVGPLGLWGIWLSRVLYTVAPRVLNEPLDHLRITHCVSCILYIYRPAPIRLGCTAIGGNGRGLQL